MAARGRRLARRIVGGAVDVVNDRAPWLTDRAYRAVATPLQWLDPVGGARAAEARLDGVRDRVAGMATIGRVRRVERARLHRDLDRTREDLARIAPRLPAVQARALAVRVDAYTAVLGALPGAPAAGPAGEGRPQAGARRPTRRRVRDVAVVAGAGAVAWTSLLLPAAGTAVVEGGLVAGVVTAVGATAVRGRRARQERIGALVRALAEVDAGLRGPDGGDPRALDGARRALLGRSLASGRLDEPGTGSLRRIDAHLDDLLLRLVEGDLEAEASYLVRATVERYLPDTLGPFLALPDPRAVVRGRPAVEEVADQLAALESGLAEVARRPRRDHPEDLLLRQGEFLRSKFGEPSG